MIEHGIVIGVFAGNLFVDTELFAAAEHGMFRSVASRFQFAYDLAEL